MALCHNCDEARIEYIGNGSQTDYTFPFEYNERTDVAVANWNEAFEVWEPVTEGWVFLNDTTIRFDPAPVQDQKFIIYRCTDLTPLPAEFYPGSAIKAQDLNDNFFVLKSAIEEARCAIQRNDEKSEGRYWNVLQYDIDGNPGQTIYSEEKYGQRWVSTDEAVASTAAISQYVDETIEFLKVTKEETEEGRWARDGELDTDEHVPTAAAASEKYDPFFQETLPPQKYWQLPGKLWFDNDEVLTRVWDQENKTWVASGLSGPPGPIGPTGTYMTIVSDNAPNRRLDNTSLMNGDVWFNSTTGELYVWYDDGQPDNIRGKQWVQALGGRGPQGPPGEPGISSYNFIEPITQDGDDVSFDVSLLQTLP